MWNWALAERIRAYQLKGETIWQKDLQGRVKEVREQFPEIMKHVPSHAPLAVLKHQDQAMRRYFATIKKAQEQGGRIGRGTAERKIPGPMHRWFTNEELESGVFHYPDIIGFPRFKVKRDQVGFNFYTVVEIEADQIKIPKIGWVSIVARDAGYLPIGKWHNQPRDYKDEDLGIGNRWFASGAVVQKNKRWYICVTVKEHIPDPNPTGPETLGIHQGVNHLATISTSDKTVKSIENPRHYRAAEKKLARLNRKIARRTRGSNRYKKAREEFNKIHEQIANRRLDTIHKLTTDLTLNRQPKKIVTEDWNIHTLSQKGKYLTFVNKQGKSIKVRNRRAAKGFLDSGLGMMNHFLKYKAAWSGAELVTADKHYPSTKRCSKCGTINQAFDGRKRRFACINPDCKHVELRERNSAKNIRDFSDP